MANFMFYMYYYKKENYLQKNPRKLFVENKLIVKYT